MSRLDGFKEGAALPGDPMCTGYTLYLLEGLVVKCGALQEHNEDSWAALEVQEIQGPRGTWTPPVGVFIVSVDSVIGVYVHTETSYNDMPEVAGDTGTTATQE